jgi:hypothetical protein
MFIAGRCSNSEDVATSGTMRKVPRMGAHMGSVGKYSAYAIILTAKEHYGTLHWSASARFMHKHENVHVRSSARKRDLRPRGGQVDV